MPVYFQHLELHLHFTERTRPTFVQPHPCDNCSGCLLRECSGSMLVAKDSRSPTSTPVQVSDPFATESDVASCHCGCTASPTASSGSSSSSTCYSSPWLSPKGSHSALCRIVTPSPHLTEVNCWTGPGAHHVSCLRPSLLAKHKHGPDATPLANCFQKSCQSPEKV